MSKSLKGVWSFNGKKEHRELKKQDNCFLIFPVWNILGVWNRLSFLYFLHFTKKKKKIIETLPQFKALSDLKHFLQIWQFFWYHSKQQKLYFFKESANEATNNFSCCGLADICTCLLPSCFPAGTVCAHWEFRPTELKCIPPPFSPSKQYLFPPGDNYYFGEVVECAWSCTEHQMSELEISCTLQCPFVH